MKKRLLAIVATLSFCLLPLVPGHAYWPVERPYNDGLFVGQLVGGKPYLYGMLKEAGGWTYIGQFKDGLYHGRGALFGASGGITRLVYGTYEGGRLVGDCVFYNSQGKRCEGSLQNGELNGPGTCTNAAGRYEVVWKDNDVETWGELDASVTLPVVEYTVDEKGYFCGETLNGVANGYGVECWPGAYLYIGPYQDGKPLFEEGLRLDLPRCNPNTADAFPDDPHDGGTLFPDEDFVRYTYQGISMGQANTYAAALIECGFLREGEADGLFRRDDLCVRYTETQKADDLYDLYIDAFPASLAPFGYARVASQDIPGDASLSIPDIEISPSIEAPSFSGALLPASQDIPANQPSPAIEEPIFSQALPGSSQPDQGQVFIVPEPDPSGNQTQDTFAVFDLDGQSVYLKQSAVEISKSNPPKDAFDSYIVTYKEYEPEFSYSTVPTLSFYVPLNATVGKEYRSENATKRPYQFLSFSFEDLSVGNWSAWCDYGDIYDTGIVRNNGATYWMVIDKISADGKTYSGRLEVTFVSGGKSLKLANGRFAFKTP